MEIGPVTRPGPSNMGSVSRVVPVTPAPPVGMRISAAAVEQAPPAPRIAADQPRLPMADTDSVDRKIEIDPETRQVIYQAVDRSTGEIVRQIPEEIMLRLQIYARAMRRADAARRGDIALTI